MFVVRYITFEHQWECTESVVVGVFPTKEKVEALIQGFKDMKKCPVCGGPLRFVGKKWKFPYLRCKDSYSRRRGSKCDWRLSLDFEIDECAGETTVEDVLNILKDDVSVGWK